MPYILSAQEAGMLAAGLTDDSHNRETQRLLTLVECAVRAACLQKKQSVELLAPDFRGWDKNNIATLSPCAGEVLDALSKAGYHFYTCHLVKLCSEYGDGVEIPYTHTVVTWPKATEVDATKFTISAQEMPSQAGYTTIGERFVDSLPVQEKPPFRRELPGTFYEKPDSSIGIEVGGSEEGDLALAESMNENLTPVCISKHGERWEEQSNLGGGAEAYYRTTTPKPGNPCQLLSKLYLQGYDLPGYNNVTEQDGPRPPCSVGALNIIAAITDSLEVAHNCCQIESACYCPRGGLIGNDMMYVLQTFSLRGFDIKYNMENEKFQVVWKPDAWARSPRVPVQASPILPTTVKLELAGSEQKDGSPIANMIDLIVQTTNQKVRLDLTKNLKEVGFWSRASWGEPGELALFRALLEGVYDSAMVGENSYSTEFILDIRPGELIEYLREVGFCVELSTVKGGDVFMQKITMSWEFL